MVQGSISLETTARGLLETWPLISLCFLWFASTNAQFAFDQTDDHNATAIVLMLMLSESAYE